MGRLTRELYLSAVYHVYNRGNNRTKVFGDEEDKELFLRLLNRYRERFMFKIFAICLMENHYHMILETNKKHNISRVMHGVALAYSTKYRKKYRYVGHLWQSRFKSRVIEREEYFFECVEYIHQNPVKAKLVESPEDYRYSSASVFAGQSQLVSEQLMIDGFGGTVYS